MTTIGLLGLAYIVIAGLVLSILKAGAHETPEVKR